ncbi:MAG: cold-shock protein [Thermomicrobiales bacterium]
MATGIVKVWSNANGFGWIMPDSGGNRMYVHRSGVVRRDENASAWLEVGEKVEYQLGQRPKGPAAINVKPVEPQAAESA